MKSIMTKTANSVQIQQHLQQKSHFPTPIPQNGKNVEEAKSDDQLMLFVHRTFFIKDNWLKSLQSLVNVLLDVRGVFFEIHGLVT